MWTEEHARWQKRDLSAKRFVYCWADGSIWRPGWNLARPCLRRARLLPMSAASASSNSKSPVEIPFS
jgi:hypothetical protein